MKKLHRKENRVYLKSTNPAYRPIEAKEITVLGKVVYLMRDYKKVKAL